MQFRKFALPLFLPSLAFATACTGTIAAPAAFDPETGLSRSGGQAGGNNAEAGSGGGGTSGLPTVEPGTPLDLQPMALPLLRLSRFEYDNVIRDLLGDTSRPARALPADSLGASGFLSADSVTELAATVAGELADTLSGSAMARLGTLLPCSPGTTDPARRNCAAQFLDTFGMRAFRRPLEPWERDGLLALYDRARTTLGQDFNNALRIVIAALLQSPQFLYHWEHAPADGVSAGDAVALDGFALASRLSFFLWGTLPDAELFDRARAGTLSEPAILAAEIDRMLADPKVGDGMGDLFGQVLFLQAVLDKSKDANRYPDWNQSLRDLLFTESRAFVEHVLREGDGQVATLLSAPFSFLNERLARHYGLSGISGDALRRVELPGAQRAGLLTQAAFLAGEAGPADGAPATPIKRGKVIRERILCQPIPPPPGNIVPPEGTVQGTTRDLVTFQTGGGGCRSCHAFMNPLGFAFEHYDAVGVYRTHEGPYPIDASGTIVGLDRDDEPAFTDGVELARVLASLPEVADCQASHLLAYGLRAPFTAEHGRAFRLLMGTQAGGLDVQDGLDLRAALLALAQSRAFTHRLAGAEEGAP